MKVLAFNTSPDKDNCSLEQILSPLIEGLQEKGADVELIYTADLDIRPCRACTEMDLFEYDGVCKCEDHMNSLYPKFREADIWIFGSPVYANQVNEDLKNLLDRMEPLFQPTFPNGNPNSKIAKSGKIAFVGTSSMWNLGSFDSLVNQLESMSLMFEREFVGSLLRPHSWTLESIGDTKLPVDDIFDSARKAGREIAEKGEISRETHNAVSKPLVEEDTMTEHLKNSKI